LLPLPAGEGLRILSDDHSVVWELVQSGRLNEEEAESHPESHIITQSLGDSRHPPRPDVLVQPLQPHDKLLLCSDGLNGMLNSEQIGQIIGPHDPLGDLCKAFIDAANRQGGEDNITW
jgi:protein phosphatase